MLLALLFACTPRSVVLGSDSSVAGTDSPPDTTDTTDTTKVTGTGTETDADTDSDTDTDTDTDTDDGPPIPNAEEQALYEAFYEFGSLHEIRLYVSDATIDAMNDDVRDYSTGRDLVMEWQHGDLEIDGQRFEDIAVRVKGSSTLQNFDGKPSLKFKLNEWVSGQTWAGLERLTLNNDVEDPSQARQVMVYHVNNKAGRLASRASHAQLYVNDELYGLYTNLETMDDRWLWRRYADGSGDLWEANDYADFSRSSVGYWELASGEVGDTDALTAVGTELNDRSDDLYGRLDVLVDMDDFTHFWAWRIMVGDLDGYPMNLNDMYIYRDPADGRFDFFPWGVDESFSDSAPDYWSYASGLLGTKCAADEECLEHYRTSLGEVVDVYETLDFVADFDQMNEATAAAMAADPRKPVNDGQAEREREALRDDLGTFPGRIRAAAGL